MTKDSARGRRFGTNQLLPLAGMGVALLFVLLGLGKYGFWHELHGPLPGFFPVLMGAALLLVSLFALLLSFRDEAPLWPRENWLIVFGAVLVVAATFLIGLVPSVALFLLVWLRRFEGCGWRTTLVTCGVVMAVVIGCFGMWLQVPFPQGLILDLLANRG